MLKIELKFYAFKGSDLFCCLFHIAIGIWQFIASAPTLFPEEYVEEFKNCFDKAPPVPFNEIESILREDLGRPINSVYEYVDSVPLASASIAQVCTC